MTPDIWLNENEVVLPQCFIDEHTNGKCISTKRVREAWIKFKESLNEADIIVNCDWIKDDIKQFEKNLYIAEK